MPRTPSSPQPRPPRSTPTAATSRLKASWPALGPILESPVQPQLGRYAVGASRHWYSNEITSPDRPPEIWSREAEFWSDTHQRPRSPIRERA